MSSNAPTDPIAPLSYGLRRNTYTSWSPFLGQESTNLFGHFTNDTNTVLSPGLLSTSNATDRTAHTNIILSCNQQGSGCEVLQTQPILNRTTSSSDSRQAASNQSNEPLPQANPHSSYVSEDNPFARQYETQSYNTSHAHSFPLTDHDAMMGQYGMPTFPLTDHDRAPYRMFEPPNSNDGSSRYKSHRGQIVAANIHSSNPNHAPVLCL